MDHTVFAQKHLVSCQSTALQDSTTLLGTVDLVSSGLTLVCLQMMCNILTEECLHFLLHLYTMNGSNNQLVGIKTNKPLNLIADYRRLIKLYPY